jgi:hypothetical protein
MPRLGHPPPTLHHLTVHPPNLTLPSPPPCLLDDPAPLEPAPPRLWPHLGESRLVPVEMDKARPGVGWDYMHERRGSLERCGQGRVADVEDDTRGEGRKVYRRIHSPHARRHLVRVIEGDVVLAFEVEAEKQGWGVSVNLLSKGFRNIP